MHTQSSRGAVLFTAYPGLHAFQARIRAFRSPFTATTSCGAIPQTQAFVLHKASSRLEDRVSQGFTIMRHRGVILAQGKTKRRGSFLFSKDGKGLPLGRTSRPLSLMTNDGVSAALFGIIVQWLDQAIIRFNLEYSAL